MPDVHGASITVGQIETAEHRAVREALGKTTPETLALADALRSRETELSQWLQDPANRKRLAADPAGALSQVIPPELVKAAGVAQKLPPEVAKALAGLQIKQNLPAQTPPAVDLFGKVWAYVTASQANLAAFQANIAGTVRSVDPAAPQPVVDTVVAAYDQAMGIFQLVAIDPAYFTGVISEGLAVRRSAELP